MESVEIPCFWNASRARRTRLMLSLALRTPWSVQLKSTTYLAYPFPSCPASGLPSRDLRPIPARSGENTQS
jgi:hypothetical protein